jgi:hypothetical protein
MSGTAAWEPPPPFRPKRKNVIIRIYDAPVYRDWTAWLTLCAGLLAGFSIGFSKPAVDLPVWLNTSLAVVFFVIAFGAVPAFLRLQVRRLIWLRRTNQEVNPERKTTTSSVLDPSYKDLSAENAPENTPRTVSHRPVLAPSSPQVPKVILSRPRPPAEPLDVGESIDSSMILKGARDSLQYPVARAVRALQIATSPKDRYDCIIDTAEALLVTLGVVAVTWLRSEQIGLVEIAEFRDALIDRGITMGHWHKMIVTLARYTGDSDLPLPGVIEGLRRMKKGKGDLLASVEALIAERNRSAHGGRPRNEVEANLRIADFFPLLELAIDRAQFLVESPWFLVRSSSYRRENGFRVTADRAMGDHPEFEKYSFESAVPLVDDNFYMMGKRGPIDLSPLLVTRYCSECHESELFYADRMDNVKGVALKSVGRGHTLFDRTLDHEIRALA